MKIILKLTRRAQRAATALHVAALRRAVAAKYQTAADLTYESRVARAQAQDLDLQASEARRAAEDFETGAEVEAAQLGGQL